MSSYSIQFLYKDFGFNKHPVLTSKKRGDGWYNTKIYHVKLGCNKEDSDITSKNSVVSQKISDFIFIFFSVNKTCHFMCFVHFR